MGAKSETKRNFENGILTDDPSLVEPLFEQFDSVWRGDKKGRRFTPQNEAIATQHFLPDHWRYVSNE